MSLIFNSVKTYVESVGRHRSIRHANTLDSLDIIQTGPTAKIEQWIPKVGAKNQFYPTMTFDSADVVDEAAEMTTLRCSYVGKMYDMGAPSVGSSTHQGEISWTNYDSVNVYIATPAVQAGGPSGTETDEDGNLIPAVPAVYAAEFVSYSWLARFIITTSIIKTLTRSPSPSIGGGSGTAQITSQFRTARVSNSNGNGLIRAVLTFPTVLLDSSVNPLNNGWFEVSSTWGPQPEIVTTLVDIPMPDLSTS